MSSAVVAGVGPARLCSTRSCWATPGVGPTTCADCGGRPTRPTEHSNAGASWSPALGWSRGKATANGLAHLGPLLRTCRGRRHDRVAGGCRSSGAVGWSVLVRPPTPSDGVRTVAARSVTGTGSACGTTSSRPPASPPRRSERARPPCRGPANSYFAGPISLKATPACRCGTDTPPKTPSRGSLPMAAFLSPLCRVRIQRRALAR